MPLARMLVNQADNDVPHDRTPLLIQLIGAHLGFRPASSAVKNGFVGYRHSDVLEKRCKPKTSANIVQLRNFLGETVN
jgi:hypothetical protein